jgi:hypothetical protein
MKSLYFVILVFTIALTFIFGFKETSVLINHQAVEATQLKMHVSVSLSKSEFKVDETGKIKIKIQNTGEIPFYILKSLNWGSHSSFTYVITDENDEIVLNPVVSEVKDTPPFQETDFIKLEKNSSITAERWLNIPSEGIKAVGKYKLTIFYHSPVLEKYAPKELKVWTKEDGLVESDTVTFVVTN